ncbi:MAG: HNH endonuclease [Trichlorobacter sp.]|uniref:HNH endonuclease n=1 Tax=Trichlorobacter sp. TaxID=2911007 RepID=UPI00256E2515|nr:HNH endonuclease signature motif containing protein [Trichlorobacter sp.]MDK9718532.1 HNH endonuclease [Trichlorobacter sp.]
MTNTAMISKGILIPWEYSDEYIEIDLTTIDNTLRISSTIEWWRKDKRWVKYSTASKIRIIEDNVIEISIIYDQDNNPHLAADDVCWGKSIIRINRDTLSGTAEWIDATDGDENNGEVTLEIIDVPLVGEIVRESVTRIQRMQAIFRSALITLDECCTITGERTKEVLEAAHIIPASRGGAEVIENGILLRADIHRLYDANMFTINESGKIEVQEDVADSYKDLLINSQLKEETLKRVQRALEYIQQNPTS